MLCGCISSNKRTELFVLQGSHLKDYRYIKQNPYIDLYPKLCQKFYFPIVTALLHIAKEVRTFLLRKLYTGNKLVNQNSGLTSIENMWDELGLRMRQK